MATELLISGGGSTAVASEELFSHAGALRTLSERLHQNSRRLAFIERTVSARSLAAIDAPMSGAAAEGHIESARQLVASSAYSAERMADALLRAAENYGWTERFTERLAQDLSARLGYALGALLPLFLIAVLPLLAVSAPAVIVGLLAARGGTRRPTRDEIRQINTALSNPTTVALLRAAGMSADDFFGGLLKLPPDLVRALGDEGVGVLGLAAAAGTVRGLAGGAGMLRETGVRVGPTASRSEANPPQGFAERVDRIPLPGARDDGAQFVIERYETPGQADRFEVYIAGTVDLSPIATGEPWDMTSNITGVAGLPAGSYRAIVEALAASGVTGSSPIVFTGYSQGGLVAALLAGSGEYNTQGLVTLGAPAGQVYLPGGFPAVVIEHSDDIVPATGGAQINRDALVVERTLFAGRDIPTDVIVPAHQLGYYRETATLLDGATSPQVRAAVAALDGFGAGATTITSTSFRAERTG